MKSFYEFLQQIKNEAAPIAKGDPTKAEIDALTTIVAVTKGKTGIIPDKAVRDSTELGLGAIENLLDQRRQLYNQQQIQKQKNPTAATAAATGTKSNFGPAAVAGKTA